MYVCTCTSIYVHIYIHIDIYTHIYIHTHIYIYIYIHTHVYIYIRTLQLCMHSHVRILSERECGRVTTDCTHNDRQQAHVLAEPRAGEAGEAAGTCCPRPSYPPLPVNAAPQRRQSNVRTPRRHAHLRNPGARTSLPDLEQQQCAAVTPTTAVFRARRSDIEEAEAPCWPSASRFNRGKARLDASFSSFDGRMGGNISQMSTQKTRHDLHATLVSQNNIFIITQLFIQICINLRYGSSLLLYLLLNIVDIL